MPESQHTPTPWKVFNGRNPGIDAEVGHSIVIYGDGLNREDCGVRGRSLEEAHANAAFIVRACNAHEELVEAAKEAHLLLSSLLAEQNEVACKLQTAITKAEGK